MAVAETVIRTVIMTSVILLFIPASIGLLLYTIIKSPARVWKNLTVGVDRSHVQSALSDPKYGEHHYVTVNGVKIHYVEKKNGAVPAGKLMLFLHGFPEFWYSWHRQMPYFASKGYRCVAVDMRGYGLSEKPSSIRAYDRDVLADDIKELVKALGEKTCTLVAHDWGGIVAYDVVRKYPDLASKFIVMNSPHPILYQKKLEGSIQAVKSLYILFFAIPFLPEFIMRCSDYALMRSVADYKKPNSNFTKDDLEYYKWAFSLPGVSTAALNYYRAMLPSLMGWAATPSYAKRKITTPTLILWGQNDVALANNLNDGIEEYIEEVKVIPIHDASHWVMIDQYDGVNKHIDAWLSEQKAK